MKPDITTATTATTTTAIVASELDARRQQLRALGFYGLYAQDDALVAEPWVAQLIEIEDRERHARSLKRRMGNARIGAFKPIADFDWKWPASIDRVLIEELFTLRFIDEAVNIVLLGPNGVGKTMLAQNLAHTGVLNGYSARFVTASDMLHDLVAQDSDASLARRLRRYTQPALLVIDELGYLSYDNRYADLLFEVITRRYQKRPVIVTTNKSFSEWDDVFPSAACVVTLVDRLIHRSELISLEGESYRRKESRERSARRKTAKTRTAKQTAP